MRILRSDSQEFDRLLKRHRGRRHLIEERVRKIVAEVQEQGDEAVIRFTKRFDRVKLGPKQLQVAAGEVNASYNQIKPDFIPVLKAAIENVTRFYRKQQRKSWRMTDHNGVVLSERFQPLEIVGIYVPSGQAPLVSTIYMTAVPARLAGVKRIIMCTPPRPDGSVDSHMLVVASLLKVDAIYRVGGAQAIAAMAFGTKMIQKVDKIVGPGNPYVTEAKRQVFGHVDIDMVAGPSEVVIIANQFANPKFIVADAEAQAEHHLGIAIVVTSSKALAKTLRAATKTGYVVLVKNLRQAAELVNRIAPEHVQILVKQPQSIVRQIVHAGAIFIGPYTPTTLGDYVAGPSHVLPTAGTARFFSGLGLDDFLKRTHIVTYTRKALEEVRPVVERIAALEGLTKHLESIKVRFET